jgi:hypothetical protein
VTNGVPEPGDRSPGFIVEPGRCWALVYSTQLQSTHCDERPTWTRRWRSPKGDKSWLVRACPAHLDGLTEQAVAAALGVTLKELGQLVMAGYLPPPEIRLASDGCFLSKWSLT